MEALHKLGIDFKVLIAQIINFGILMAVLAKLLYRPILKVLDQRRKRIEESLKKAEEVDQRSAQIEEEAKKRRELAKAEAASLVEDAKKVAEKGGQQILIKASEESDRLKAEARAQMEREREQLRAGEKSRVGKLALLLVTKSLQQEMGEEFYKRNIDKALTEIEAL